MAKFIIDTDVLAENSRLYKNAEETTIYILNTLRAAHKGVVTAPWLTPYPVKKKQGIDGSGPYSYLFEGFWADYPMRNGKKTGKRPAFKAWARAVRLNGGDEGNLLHNCRETLEWQKRHEDWTKDKGTFIPLASTYLNAEGWTDERPEGLSEAKIFTDMDGRVIEQ